MPKKLIYILLLNLATAAGLCVTAQLLLIVPGLMPGFHSVRFAINFSVAYPCACLIGWFVPAERLGLAVNGALHTKPGALAFRLVMNLGINLVFTVLMSAAMTALNVLVLEGGTLPMFLGSYAGSLIPMYLASCLVSWVAEPPAGRAAARLAGG